MKNIYSIILSVLMILVTACSGVLDTPPTVNPSENIFWQSKEDYEKALTACYNGFIDKNISILSWCLPVLDGLTDNARAGANTSKGCAVDEIQDDRATPSGGGDNGLIAHLYKESYSAIARINIFLDHLNAYEGGDVADVRDNMIGEAMFLRSYCYYMLYLFYGEVPYITEPLTVENQNQPKVTLEEVYTKLKADIQIAIDKLEDKTYKEAKGHATKGAAKALKARLLMFHAYNDETGVVVNQAEVEEAYNLLDQIKGYSLIKTYAHNFTTDNQNESDEIVFSIKYLAPNNIHTLDHSYGNNVMFRPLQDLTDAYESGDNRLNQIVSFNDKCTFPGGEEVTLVKSSFTRKMIKWLRPILTQSEPYWSDADLSAQDAIIFRWGELMLLKAEAANELNKSGANALVNVVRERAGLAPLPENLSQSEMREAIRKERRVETPFEGGLRFYDMRRWGLMNKLNGSVVLDPEYSGIKMAWKKEHKYLPIPQNQIEFSNGVLKQNPNY